MKTIIAGSRSIDWSTFLSMWSTLPKDVVSSITEVVSGGAVGPDKFGEIVAKHNSIKIKLFIPEWKRLRKRAGILRNIDMGDYADQAIIFWDGESRGSKHMEEYMKSLNKPVYLLIKEDIKK